MPKREQVAALIKSLTAGYPRTVLTGQNIKAYVDRLEDLPINFLSIAVGDLLDSSKYFPSIQEIREKTILALREEARNRPALPERVDDHEPDPKVSRQMKELVHKLRMGR